MLTGFKWLRRGWTRDEISDFINPLNCMISWPTISCSNKTCTKESDRKTELYCINQLWIWHKCHCFTMIGYLIPFFHTGIFFIPLVFFSGEGGVGVTSNSSTALCFGWAGDAESYMRLACASHSFHLSNASLSPQPRPILTWVLQQCHRSLKSFWSEFHGSSFWAAYQFCLSLTILSFEPINSLTWTSW
jgi:hypothetical protein